MSSDRLGEIFDTCVTRMAAGASVERCLGDYPGDADGLRPLLETVMLMRRALPPAHEVIAAQNRSRATMMAAVQAVPAARRRRPSYAWARTLASVAVLVVVLLGALTYAAESALPGDTLFPVKLVSEAARLSLTHDPALAALFAQRRISEVKTVLADGRQVAVNFAGQVETMSGSRWQVSGLPVEISATTEMKQAIQPGDEVIIEGFAASGVVRAEEIERLAPKKITPTPVFTPTEQILPTSTPTGLPSRTPSPSSTPSAPTSTPEGACILTPPDGWVTYSLRAGDTTSELAAATSISLDQLLTVNCLTMADARALVVGQTLYLPFVPPTPRPKATSATQAGAAQPASSAGSGNTGSSGSSSSSGSESHDGHSGQGSSGGSDNSGSSGGSDNSGSNSGNDGSGSSDGGGSDSSGSNSGSSGGSDDSSSHSGSNDDSSHSGSSNDSGSHGSDDGT